MLSSFVFPAIFFQAAEPFLLKGLFGLGPLKAHIISSADLCFLSLSLSLSLPFRFSH